MSAQQFLQTQFQLIQFTQEVLMNAFEQEDYGTAQAIGELLHNLTGSYAHIKGSAGNASPKPSFLSGRPAANQVAPKSEPRQRQFPKPAAPSTYKWADNFEGVSLPQQQLDDLPMQDAWDE